MDINISKLPVVIRYHILEYINYNYIFDKDIIYFKITPMIHCVNEKLCINIFCWFGVYDKIYNNFNILHTIYNRPYTIEVERIFHNIINILFEEIKKFRFNRYNHSVNSDHIFNGTFGPVKKRFKELLFNKNGKFSWSLVITNKLEYFKNINFVSDDKTEINKSEEEILKNKLYLELQKNINNCIKKYSINLINNIKLVTIKEEDDSSRCCTYLYNIRKKYSDNSYIDKKNLFKVLYI